MCQCHKTNHFLSENQKLLLPTTVMAKSDNSSQVGDSSHFANVVSMLPIYL